MSDTTVNLRGSSKTMSLALALPIKMGRNITHYLYQPQCSHVQRGYTAHVQTHPKIRSSWWQLYIQWKYPHCTDIVPLTPNNMPRSVSGLVVQQFDGAFFHNFNECNCSIYDWGLYMVILLCNVSNKPSPTELQTWVHTFGIHIWYTPIWDVTWPPMVG